VSGRGAAFRGRSRATHGACHRGGPGLRPQGGSTGLMRRRARESRSRILRVPAPGHWRGPRARHPACGRPRPSSRPIREVCATALKARPSRSARPKTKAPRAGCRGRFRPSGGWPCPCPDLSARGRPRRGPPGPRAPLSFSRAARPARPSCLGPDQGRENENACPHAKLNQPDLGGPLRSIRLGCRASGADPARSLSDASCDNYVYKAARPPPFRHRRQV
jgi:hypothetical protein